MIYAIFKIEYQFYNEQFILNIVVFFFSKTITKKLLKTYEET